MQGEALEAFLQQFAADNIETVEVLENPSARYGAEGSGGIVNNVLNRGTSLDRSDPRRMTLSSLDDVRALEGSLRESAAAACRALASLMDREEPLGVLRELKFREVGFDPLAAERPLNLLQQVHQTFAYLARLRGAEHLLRVHPEHAPYRLNLARPAEPDIASAYGQVVAEALALVTSAGNSKLRSDLERLRASAAPLRYLFYYSDEAGVAVTDAEIRVVAVDL